MNSFPHRYLPILLSLLVSSVQGAQPNNTAPSSLSQKIDENICSTLTQQGHSLDNYFNDHGQGKFAAFCEKNGFDDEAIKDEINCEVADCAFGDLVNEFEDFFPSTTSTEEAKQKFVISLIKKAYKSCCSDEKESVNPSFSQETNQTEVNLQHQEKKTFKPREVFELKRRDDLYFDQQGNAYSFFKQAIHCLHVQSEKDVYKEMKGYHFSFSLTKKGKCYLYMKPPQSKRPALYRCKVSTDGKEISFSYDKQPITIDLPWLELRTKMYFYHDETYGNVYAFTIEQEFLVKKNQQDSSRTISQAKLNLLPKWMQHLAEYNASSKSKLIKMLKFDTKNEAVQSIELTPPFLLTANRLTDNAQLLGVRCHQGKDHLLWFCNMANSGKESPPAIPYHIFMITFDNKGFPMTEECKESDDAFGSIGSKLINLGKMTLPVIESIYIIPTDKKRQEIKLASVKKVGTYDKRILINTLTLNLSTSSKIPLLYKNHGKPSELTHGGSQIAWVATNNRFKDNTTLFQVGRRTFFCTVTGEIYYIDLEKGTLQQINQAEIEFKDVSKKRGSLANLVSSIYPLQIEDKIYLFYLLRNREEIFLKIAQS
ncbi:MAG: hypothetical protein AAF335_00805 [Bacteroidota bacterium]